MKRALVDFKRREKRDCVIVFPNDFFAREFVSRDDFLENSHEDLPAPPRPMPRRGRPERRNERRALVQGNNY